MLTKRRNMPNENPVKILQFSGRRISACRAVQRIITDSFTPGCESDADFRFGIMDFTIYLSIICPKEKRAVCENPAVSIYPIVNADNLRKVLKYKIPSVAMFPVRKFQRNVLKDILPVGINPRDKVFDNPFLAPPPLLTTLTAL